MYEEWNLEKAKELSESFISYKSFSPVGNRSKLPKTCNKQITEIQNRNLQIHHCINEKKKINANKVWSVLNIPSPSVNLNRNPNQWSKIPWFPTTWRARTLSGKTSVLSDRRHYSGRKIPSEMVAPRYKLLWLLTLFSLTYFHCSHCFALKRL